MGRAGMGGPRAREWKGAGDCLSGRFGYVSSVCVSFGFLFVCLSVFISSFICLLVSICVFVGPYLCIVKFVELLLCFCGEFIFF